MMKKTKLILLLLLVLILILLVVQNTATVTMHFFWMTAEMPMVFLLFLTAAGGFLSGLLAALLLKSGSKT